MPALSYASIARSGKAQEQQAKTRFLLVYPKEANKEQTSEETKIDLQTKLKPKQMKLQVNKISKIYNGRIAIEVPTDQSEELDKASKKDFNTRTPKTNKPKFKIVDVPANLDKDQFTQTVFEQNFSEKISYENFLTKFVPLFKTGPREETITQWIVEIAKEVLDLIPLTDRV